MRKLICLVLLSTLAGCIVPMGGYHDGGGYRDGGGGYHTGYGASRGENYYKHNDRD
jgi:hypothetical protein